MKNYLLTFLLLLLYPEISTAQQEGSVWAFGNGAGIDFTTGNPIVFQSAAIHFEGCASVADAGGQLLFYTDGDRIYNSAHQIMPNGVLFYGLPYPLWGAGPIYSSTQSTLILPMPGAPTKYYVFSLASAAFGYLWYSIVDMSLDNGLGDVVSSKKNVLLNNGPLSEKMTVVRGDNCNVWLMLHGQQTNNYMALEITPAGINTVPVTSPAVMATAPVGVIKFSQDRQKMVAASYGDDNKPEALYLYTFDPGTGILNYEVQLDNAGPYYGACFSPGNTKLYATNYGGSLFQYDLNQPTNAAIIASKALLSSSANGDLKLAPDGRLYFTNAGSSFVGRINLPDLPGIASAVNANAVALLPNTMGFYGLPNEIVVVKDTTTSRSYSKLACFQDSLVLQGNPTGFNYSWEDGTSSAQRTVYQSGTYYLNYETGCKQISDTFNVILQKMPEVTADSVCPGTNAGKVAAIARDNTTYTYHWTDAGGQTIARTESSTGSVIYGMVPGVYTLELTSEAGCATTVNVTAHAYPEADVQVTPEAVTLPYGDSIQLQASGAMLYAWWPSGTVSNDTVPNPYVRPLSPVVYTVLGINEYGCRDTAIVTIDIDYTMPDFIPNAFSPNGDGLNDVFKVAGVRYQKLVAFQVFNRWGKRVFETMNPEQGWDGSSDGKPCDMDTYYYLISLSYPDGKLKTFKGDVLLVR